MILVISTGKLKPGLEDKVKAYTDSKFISDLENIPGIKSVCVGFSSEKREMVTAIQ